VSRRSSEVTVAVAFLAGAAAAVGFIAAYVLDADTPVLGLLLGLACAGMALGLVLWSGKLLPAGTFVEKREPMPPPEDEQTAFVQTFVRGGAQTPGIVRRTVVLAGLALGAAVVVPFRSLLLPGQPHPGRALETTPWQRGDRMVTRDGRLVLADDVEVGSFLTVFPEGDPEADDATAVLIKLDPALLDRPGAVARSGSAQGLVAFSKLCTHAGCPVGLYEQTTHQLLCPCHQTVFDVLSGAQPIAGPAARPLPQLPLRIDDQGYVEADGGFHGQVGPTYWRRE
jgi:ubiquinol-cytochrome c reductase iron-sulfur subunit